MRVPELKQSDRSLPDALLMRWGLGARTQSTGQSVALLGVGGWLGATSDGASTRLHATKREMPRRGGEAKPSAVGPSAVLLGLRRLAVGRSSDLLVAGLDTTSSTVEWIMGELLRNPDKLAKARKELSQAIDKDELPEEQHILKLPFLRAVVKETLCLHPPGPFLIPHKCDEMVSISGFKVPKNAQVLVNVWAMGRDPTIWENPEMFIPERFLERESDFKGHDFELIPFGTGKRICLGLSLAHRSMHLMVASLVHNFEWKLA
ncbi:Geraniol 8-hydroxylase [Spatholobus suberectus]|nr:Geraniol 8-hydroxylase [Spatholobus suberectus]